MLHQITNAPPDHNMLPKILLLKDLCLQHVVGDDRTHHIVCPEHEVERQNMRGGMKGACALNIIIRQTQDALSYLYPNQSPAEGAKHTREKAVQKVMEISGT